MSGFKMCDWCHQPINADEPQVWMSVGTIRGVTRRSFDGWRMRDYHASADRDCFGDVREAIDAVHDMHHALET